MNNEIITHAYSEFFESLSAGFTKEHYSEFFDVHSEFQDPFQKVQGLDSIYNIFADMYLKLYNPYFVVNEVVCSNEVSYLRWEFFYSLSQTAQKESFIGVSRVTFSTDGKVLSHIDYWDAAEHIYEKIPLLGSFIRFFKRKIHA